MTLSPTHLQVSFEGIPISTLPVSGRPAWIAREIGAACGYAQDGKRFVTLITTEWADEFIEGVDYVLLTGSELAAAIGTERKGTEHGPFESRRGLLLLLEPGLYLALVKTHKPIGKRLRRFIAQEVLPQIARDGRFLPERVPSHGLARFDSLRTALTVSSLASSEERLVQSAELCTLLVELDKKGMLARDVQTAYQVLAAELAIGTGLAALMPVVADVWSSPTEIADRLGVTPQRVGRVITSLGLRGKEGLSRKIINKAKGHARTVESFLYCPAAVEMIERALGTEGTSAPESANQHPSGEGDSDRQGAT